MKPLLKRRRNIPSPERQLAWLERWFDSERGQRLLSRERELLYPALAEAFGYHLLQLSVDARIELYDNCRVQRKFRAHPFDPSLDVLCHGEQLPFASESLDVVILHHVHEFIDDPYQVLREIQRVIIPYGQVMILGFNPWSPLGAYAGFHRWLPESHWQNHLITSRRMKDWLGLLGFETVSVDYGLRLPRRDRPWMDALARRWPFGDFYQIVAIKQVASINPVKPRWKDSVAAFPGLAPVKPPVAGSRAARRLAPDSAPRRSRDGRRVA